MEKYYRQPKNLQVYKLSINMYIKTQYTYLKLLAETEFRRANSSPLPVFNKQFGHQKYYFITAKTFCEPLSNFAPY